MVSKVVVVSMDREDLSLSQRVFQSIKEGIPTSVEIRPASAFKSIQAEADTTLVVFVVQTVENDDVPESCGAALRFFKRKTHAADLLLCQYAVLGAGDSNLLLDRQTTTARDCNTCAFQLDTRLAALGARRLCDLGLTDERTGMTEVEPWIASLLSAITTPTPAPPTETLAVEPNVPI
ncbi:hypothetical protein B484DRAFT_451722 [Ochromonadaceae sp. CCMP2298]|nr:hypothetical protein B484DRAFT_451722 [Ochromonadaceae sp. CCMP2298]